MDTTYTNPNKDFFKLGQGGNPIATSTPTSISADMLNPATPINLSPAPQDTTNYSATMQGIPDYTEILKAMQTPTPQEQEVSKNKGFISDLMGRITGKGGSVGANGQIDTEIAKNNALETNIKNFGYANSGDAYKQLSEVNNQINALRKEAMAIPLQIQEEFKGRGATASGVAPIEASRLRENAIKSLGLASIAETIQGNISTASSLAERAVNMEFAPIQAELNTLRFNYEMNKDELERADKKKAQQLEFILGERERQLNENKENKKTIFGLVAEASKLGNAPTLFLNKALQTNNPIEAMQILAPYLENTNERIKEQLDIQYKKAQISKMLQSSSLSTNKITLTEARNNKLPMYVVGLSEQEIAQSLYSNEPPEWFVKKVNDEAGQSVFPSIVKTEWDIFKNKILSGQKDKQTDEELANPF